MGVLPDYLLVKKVSNQEDFFTSDHYINEYQTCLVVESNCEEISNNDNVLVGNKIFFDPATEIGKDLFFIYVEEVYGIISGDSIVPMNDFVYIKANKARKSEVSEGRYFSDTTYNPHDKDNIVQDGVVFSVCKKAKDSYFSNDLNVEVSAGDKVYTHHFLTDEDNERFLNGEMYYEIKYENLYCKISDSDIVMLNDWNFVTPIEKEKEISESGIELDLKQSNKLRVGVINYSCASLEARNINKGDTIFFKEGREYEIDIEGSVYYRIGTNDIIYKIK